MGTEIDTCTGTVVVPPPPVVVLVVVCVVVREAMVTTAPSTTIAVMIGKRPTCASGINPSALALAGAPNSTKGWYVVDVTLETVALPAPLAANVVSFDW